LDEGRDRALAYLSVEGLGDYALVGPISREGMPPKHFLVRMSPESVEEHRRRGAEFRRATASCVTTSTGARFCIIRYDGQELEAMEMCRPVEELKEVVEKGRRPTIEECRAIGKNDFLVIKAKPPIDSGQPAGLPSPPSS
jgi:hypothetical protein